MSDRTPENPGPDQTQTVEVNDPDQVNVVNDPAEPQTNPDDNPEQE